MGPASLEDVGGQLGLLREDVRRQVAALERRLEHVQGGYETLANEVATLRRRADAIDAQLVKVNEVALVAMRQSDQAHHEIGSIGAGLTAHLARAEAHQSAEAREARAAMFGMVEHLKSFARGLHASDARVSTRLDEYQAAIRAMAKHWANPRQIAVLAVVMSALVQIVSQLVDAWMRRR